MCQKTYIDEYLWFTVYSSSSSLITKYDPDLLKSDVAHARSRVSRLKRELEQIRTEMNCTQRGVNTLARYNMYKPYNRRQVFILIFIQIIYNILLRNYEISCKFSQKLFSCILLNESVMIYTF